MIARSLASAFVLALPLLANEQAHRARWSSAQTEAPTVRVWIPYTWNFRYGQQVPVSFEVSEDAHVAVFRIDSRGRMTVLWPQRKSLQTAARPGREYRISGPYANYGAFVADYEFGQGMVIAVASSDPIDLSAFRRYRNESSLYYANQQRPYFGGVKNIVDRLTQEILYSYESAYDYDVAFYSSSGSRSYASQCNTSYYPRWGWSAYSAVFSASPLGFYDDDCYPGQYYGGYLAYCASWRLFHGYYDSNWCRFGNPLWPTTPGGPIAGPGPQPKPQPYTDMIDTVMSRPVALERNDNQSNTGSTTGTPGGTTHTVVMQPALDGPNVTRWLPADENDAISLPSRFRRETSEPSRRGGGFNTRDEGFTRSPGTGIRVADPRGGDTPPARTPGSAFMPPVREPPRPVHVTRDADGSTYSNPRWERPTMSEPRNPGSGSTDRGQTSTGSSSPSSGGAVMPPRTDASVTKTDGKASDAKASTERKPQQ